MTTPALGVFNINKPAEWSSRDVVNRISRAVKPAKAGHAGTLDPLATGVLIVCVGRATRLISRVQQQPKTYVAEFTLGQTSPTLDKEGEITVQQETVNVSSQQIHDALQQQVGRIQQKPPAFSAVHVKGRRAYDLARRGQAVDIPAREVDVYRMDILHFENERVQVEIECGSGTYIRSIARDLGETLGCGALMSQLERTAIGPFRIADAVSPQDVNRCNFEDAMMPAALLVSDLPQYTCRATDIDFLRAGRPILMHGEPEIGENTAAEPEFVAILDPNGRLLALAIRENSHLQPKQVFLKGD